MKNVKVIMQFIRSTKNTHLYAPDSDGELLTSIYVQKDAMPTEPPAYIVVTVADHGEVQD